MDNNFWIERWEQNQIGFHQAEYNTYLQKYWKALDAELGSCVFVPLCGKSLDSLWLRAQGYKVLGIEISQLAISDFFKENKLKPISTKQGKFTQWKCDDITLLQGDFFDLSADDLKQCKTVFDRAALIALPAQMRIDYAKHLINTLPQDAKILLITLEYDQKVMHGPPFSVSENEVQQHYKKQFEIRVLHREDMIDNAQPFKNRGLTSLIETVYLLSRI